MHEGHSAFRPLIRVMYLLAILSLSSGLFQRSESQDISEYEILALGQQLKVIEDKITPIDSELNLLVPEYDRITNEISELKTDLLESKGIFSGITEIFKKRRIGNLSTQAQEMNQKITQLQKKREPLAKEFIIIADRLIDKCGLRIVTLMDSLLKNTTDDNISIRISAIWQLAEKTSVSRNRYIKSAQVEEKPFLPPIGNDPVKLRQASRIAKSAAKQSRIRSQEKRQKVKELQSRKRSYERMIERWREIQRSNEESESRGGEIGTANIPTGFNESDIRKKIDKIQKDIGTISTQIREHEDNARSLENQSKILDQRASLIESMQKGKL